MIDTQLQSICFHKFVHWKWYLYFPFLHCYAKVIIYSKARDVPGDKWRNACIPFSLHSFIQRQSWTNEWLLILSGGSAKELCRFRRLGYFWAKFSGERWRSHTLSWSSCSRRWRPCSNCPQLQSHGAQGDWKSPDKARANQGQWCSWALVKPCSRHCSYRTGKKG